MKLIIFLIAHLTFHSCFGQTVSDTEASFTDGIRQFFEYDSLAAYSCINTPPGIYALKFKVDANENIYGFVAADSSLTDLNRLFIRSVQRSAARRSRLKRGSYLQIIYFNNIVACNPFRDRNNIITLTSDTSVNLSESYEKDVRQILSDQIASIESTILSLQRFNLQNEAITFLPPAFINNIDPNKKINPSIKRKKQPSAKTEQETEAIERRIDVLRKQKQKTD